MSMDINTATIRVDITDWRDRWVIRWEDEDGNRFRFFTKVGTLESKTGYIEKDPPKGCHRMEYYSTRKLDIFSKASQSRLEIVLAYVKDNELVEKAQAELRAKEVARIEHSREHSIIGAKRGRGVELYNHLRQLVAAQRRATTQHALDGLCDEAEGLLAQIEAEIAEINAEADKNISLL